MACGCGKTEMRTNCIDLLNAGFLRIPFWLHQQELKCMVTKHVTLYLSSGHFLIATLIIVQFAFPRYMCSKIHLLKKTHLFLVLHSIRQVTEGCFTCSVLLKTLFTHCTHCSFVQSQSCSFSQLVSTLLDLEISVDCSDYILPPLYLNSKHREAWMVKRLSGGCTNNMVTCYLLITSGYISQVTPRK